MRNCVTEGAQRNSCGEAVSAGESTKMDPQEIEPWASTQAAERRCIAVVGSEIGDGARSHNLHKAKNTLE